MQLKLKIDIIARPADYFRRCERYVEVVRFQDDFLGINDVADCVQAFGSAVLLVRAAAENEKS